MTDSGKLRCLKFFIWVILFFSSLPVAKAQQQQQGICTLVKMEIMQELALERIGFEATLKITNNDPTDPITGFSAALTFENPALTTNKVSNDSSSLFFVRAPDLAGIGDVNGGGIIPPGQTATIKWFIIPKPSAGGTTAFGLRYFIGCQMVGNVRGERIPDDVLFAIPDSIDVKPDPLLDITYFQPRDVQGDDPFTETVESPVPFILGVLVRNVGYGMARSVYIHSEQPKIVENKQGALLVARLLGTRIMDYPLDMTTLRVNIGDLAPGTARKASWDMITSLSGEFIEFKADYTHAPELGGRETSIITNLSAHFLVHEVINDQPGRDDIKDFLADVDRDTDFIADTLYESEGQILPVNHIVNTSVETWGGGSSPFDVRCDALASGWSYIRVSDPGQAGLPISSVERDDGKIINSNNVWTSYHYDKDNNRLNYLHIFDLVSTGSNIYSVTYGSPGGDTNPPVTKIEFAGYVEEQNGKYYIPPETQMFFISEDQHPVSLLYSLDGGAFLPAFPFNLNVNGEHTVEFYAEDSVGNVEATQTVAIVVSDEAPVFGAFGVSDAEIVLVGDAVAVRPSETRISFSVASNAMPVNAQLDIFRDTPLLQVVSRFYSDVSGTVAFDWDGTDDAGVDVLPGWYTARLTLTDPLGHTNFVTSSIYIETLEPTETVLADIDTGADRPYGRGSLLLWQEQKNGSDQIYSRQGVAVPYQVTSGNMNQQHPVTDGRYTVWQGRQTNGTWDIYFSDIETTGSVMRLTATSNDDEINASIDWPWVVYQRRSAGAVNDPWQLYALNLKNLTEVQISATTQDQLYPAVQAGRVVWQDWRDNGPGEIYLKNLESTQDVVRVTDNIYGQSNPCIYDNWIIWQDNRNSQFDLYGFDLLAEREIRITSTTENETYPYLQGDWLVCLEDSLGTDIRNLRLIHIPSLRVIPLTRTLTKKAYPCMAGASVAWLDDPDNDARIYQASLPGLQAMFKNMNAVPITPVMVTNSVDAFTLLTQWHDAVGISEITRFASLTPVLVKETAKWSGMATGVNFPLIAGDFLWVRFDSTRIIDLGLTDAGTIDLPAGISVIASTRLPQPFSAYRMIRQLGLDKVRALRILDGTSGRWLTAEVRDGRIIGYDFPIHRSSVVLLDMITGVTGWRAE